MCVWLVGWVYFVAYEPFQGYFMLNAVYSFSNYILNIYVYFVGIIILKLARARLFAHNKYWYVTLIVQFALSSMVPKFAMHFL